VRSLFVIAACVAAMAFSCASAMAQGLGDPFFPNQGNPGYDVSDYDVALSYAPSSNRLVATETISATATSALSAFSLDLHGLTVDSATVNGAAAQTSRGKDKLDITPATPVAAGAAFTTVLSYRGHPGKIRDPDKSFEGWFRTKDGAVAFGEPVGTMAWVACNNTLLDKATWSFHVSVPSRLHGIAAGRLLSVAKSGSTRTFNWRSSQPMLPYLASMEIGPGPITKSTSAGFPTWSTVESSQQRPVQRRLRKLGGIIRFEQGIYGTYPFDSAGSIVRDTNAGYALETQTRPTYGFPTDLTTIVHETAHQWFGDSVSIATWPDIWLNEGFAQWTEWYYSEKHGGYTARHAFKTLYAYPASKRIIWDPPPGRPGKAKNLFAESIYLRGAMTLEALRMKVGTQTLLRIMRTWADQHRYGTVTTPEFISLAETVSGQDLGSFFQRWLYKRGKPAKI